MPELPEVETIRKTLKALVSGKTIASVDVRWPKMIKKPDDVERFKEGLCGQTIRDIRRRGKFLLFDLDDVTLVSHLRMEGKYGLFKKEEAIDKHTHVIFSFDDETELRYNDVRKFGTMHLFRKGEEEHSLPLSQLGIEPFSPSFTPDFLKRAFQKTSRVIKVVLLDQTIVVGLGNIYVDESLFRAGIHPERVAATLTDEEISRLHEAILITLQEALDLGGSTIKSYVNGQGEIGMFQQRLSVYGRKEEACFSCGTPITRVVVGGRGTHFCSHCQK